MQACREVEAVGDLAGSGEHDEIGILDEIGQFTRLVARIDRDGDRAGHGDTEQQFDEFGAGGQQNTDMLARLDAKADQRACPCPRRLVQVAIGLAAIWKHQGVNVVRPGRAVTQQGTQGQRPVAHAVTSCSISRT